jgi:hypothetical protein
MRFEAHAGARESVHGCTTRGRVRWSSDLALDGREGRGCRSSSTRRRWNGRRYRLPAAASARDGALATPGLLPTFVVSDGRADRRCPERSVSRGSTWRRRWVFSDDVHVIVEVDPAAFDQAVEAPEIERPLFGDAQHDRRSWRSIALMDPTRRPEWAGPIERRSIPPPPPPPPSSPRGISYVRACASFFAQTDSTRGVGLLLVDILGGV